MQNLLDFVKSFFIHIFLVAFFMLNSNFFSDWNYHERFLRFLNCTEPHNRFFGKNSVNILKKYLELLGEECIINLFLKK